MNEKLRFAFATVVTLVAVLWISYCVFCGFIYLNGDLLGENVMIWSGIVTAVIFICLIASFIGVQMLKATDHHFRKFIVWERIFMFGICPIVFLLAGYFYSHFFTVHAQAKDVKNSFVESVQNAENIFAEYRTYANSRIEEYRADIDVVKYANNKVHVLETRILHPALDSLEMRCKEWIKDVDENVTTWNPFLLGNIPYVKKGIKDWHVKLYELSCFHMQEENDVSYFDENEMYIQNVLNGLTRTQSIYSQWKFPNFWAILTGIISYFFLIVAYLIQERNNKSTYLLLSNNRYKTLVKDINYTNTQRGNKKINKTLENDPNGGTF